MSGLNINSNTLYTIFRGERGIYQPTVSASIFLYGGGGDGGSPVTTGPDFGLPGGGGGAGSVVSASIVIPPYMTNTVVVGGGASGSSSGGTTYFDGYTFDEFTKVSGYAAGGGTPTAFVYNGGSNGGGEFAYPWVTQSFAGYTGGTGTNIVGVGGLVYRAAGGGAGSAQNGENHTYAPPTLQSGDGGNGVTSSLKTFGTPIDTFLGAAGGGGGGVATITSTGTNPAGTVPAGGFFGGDPGSGPGVPRWGAGGAGGYVYDGFGPINPTSGSDGTVVIVYCGEPKLVVENATTIYDSGSNSTYHSFAKGSGSFCFCPPYLNVPQCT